MPRNMLKYSLYVDKTGEYAGDFPSKADAIRKARELAKKLKSTISVENNSNHRIEFEVKDMNALDKAIKTIDAPDIITIRKARELANQMELSKKFDKYCEDIYKKAKASNDDREIKNFVNQLNSEMNKYVRNRWSDIKDIREIYYTWYFRIVNLKFNMR